MMDELDQLLTISTGVGEIVQDFAIDELDPQIENFNWKVKDGDLEENVYGQTYDYNSNTKTAFTKFDTDKFDNASNLSVARTMLHESVHAYLTALFYEDGAAFQKTYAELFEMYQESKDIEESQHQKMAEDYVAQIADALQELGNHYGYSLDYQYYHDLAWGGLAGTEYFNELDTEDQQRINNRILIELTGRNSGGEYRNPEGASAGC